MAEKVSQYALIVGAAPCADLAFLKDYLGEKDWTVICADGGLNAALAAGLCPDYLIGDWDSGGRPAGDMPCTTLPVEKDFTDLQAAAHWALEQGCRKLLLCGCTGGRLDHTASNLVLLEWIARRGGNAVMADRDNEVRFLENGTLTLADVPHYHYLSVIPLDKLVKGVTLQGVKYPLEGAVITRGDTLTVSNEPSAPVMEITVEDGAVLLIRSQRENQGSFGERSSFK